jgi:hypothetical protein
MGWQKLLVNLGTIITAGAVAISLQMPLLSRRTSGQTPEGDRQAERQEAARLAVLRQLPPRGFGYNNLIASYGFLQFLQYFGDDVARSQHRLGYALSGEYFRTIVPRDPRFIQAYLYMSASMSLFAGQAKQAVELYRYGTDTVSPLIQPTAYTIWRRKATDQLLFLADAAGARQSLLKAAEWANLATFDDNDLPETQIVPNSNPPMRQVALSSLRTAEWLEGNRDLRNAQISAWQTVLNNATDRKTIDRIATEIDKLGLTIELRGTEGNEQLVIVPKSPSDNAIIKK